MSLRPHGGAPPCGAIKESLRAGRRLAALTYVLDYGGAPLPKSRGRAARRREFAAPSPFLRVALPGFAPVDGTIVPDRSLPESEIEATSPKSNWAPTPTADAPLNMNSEELTPPRVRLEKETRMPADPGSRVASVMDPASQGKKLSTWVAQGRGKLEQPQWSPRGV